MKDEIITALKILIKKCDESMESGKMMLSDEELDLLSALSAWYEGYLVGKTK